MRICFGIFIVIVFQLIAGCLPVKKKNPAYANDGMIIVNDQRKFILGLYQKPIQSNAFESLVSKGYNLVSLPADTRSLDSAKAAGIMCWVTLGTLDTLHREDSWLPIRKKMDDLKNHSSLLAWELADEPAYTWNSNKLRIIPEIMKETHDSVVNSDPNHPIYLNHAPVNLVETMRRYNNSNDITACDIYPVIPQGIKAMYALNPDGRQGDLANSTLSQVGDYVDKMRMVCGPNRPLLMVLQGFAWEMLRTAAERDSTKILYPDYHESWFMAWNAIIHGANGLIWWGTAYTPYGHPFLKNLDRVVKNLSSLEKILSLPDQPNTMRFKYIEMGHTINNGIEVITKQEKDTVWIFTANTEHYPVKVEILAGFPVGAADVLFENRSIQITGNTFTENYEPYGVHLYKITHEQWSKK
ncbi:MAG: hypothetical protein WCP08_07405 [Prolixibacteraceae bacterium]